MVLDLNFTAIEKDDIDIHGLHKYFKIPTGRDIDIDYCKPTVYVRYQLQPEAREWGIKSIYIQIDRVYGSIEWYVAAEELSGEDKALLIAAGGTEMRNGNIEGTIEIDTLGNVPLVWTTETEMEFKSDGGLIINSISVDFNNSLITVS